MKRYIYSYLALGFLVAGLAVRAGQMSEQLDEIMQTGSNQPQAQKQSNEAAAGLELAEIMAKDQDVANQVSQLKAMLNDFHQQLQAIYQKSPELRPASGTTCMPSDVSKKLQDFAGQFLSPEEMGKAVDVCEFTYGTLAKLVPGFDPIKLFETTPAYAQLIMTAITWLKDDLVQVQQKGYTPEVIPYTIKVTLRALFKGKDFQEIIGFMNAAYAVGLPYFANAAASLFVDSQLPTTALSKGVSKVKRLFCMGPIDPNDLMEKAIDMGVDENIANTYIKKHVAMYKKHFAYEEVTVADWVIFKEQTEDDPHKNYGNDFLARMATPLIKKGFEVIKEIEKTVTWLPGLTSLDGMNFLDATNSREDLLILGYKGDFIPAYAFKTMSHLKSVEIKGIVSPDFSIQDNAFAGLNKLEMLIIDNAIYSKGTWGGWFVRGLGFKGPLKLDLRKETFAGLDQLQYLAINQVHIPYIRPGTFDLMPNLEVLKLENGELDTIDAETFKGLPNLKNLYLGNNTIQLLNDRAFDGLAQLKLLSLENNNLSSLFANQFKELKKLGFLDLRGNPISTDALTKLRRGLRKGCYIATDFEKKFERTWWGLHLEPNELKRLNDALSVQEESEQAQQ